MIDFEGKCVIYRLCCVHQILVVDAIFGQVSGTIIAPKEPRYWDGLNPRKWLYFHGLDDFVVKGGGTVNGMGEKWWAKSCKVNTTHVRNLNAEIFGLL